MLTQNDVVYLAPSDDPWMPAQGKVPGTGTSICVAEYNLNLMGCIDQYQICNPQKGNDPSACTKLSGQVAVSTELVWNGKDIMGLNDHQSLTALRIMGNAISMGMFTAVEGRGASALNGGSTFPSFLLFLFSYHI